ncbi:uncharacterized protein BXZ73DRAFT_73481 [Epithele typhae]|uniref:uncharacterized protein n=1 Tax=Epithele typhae TaxID=378194 RepID=UPI0020085BB3|nr:uncharacterized protein BXZ73DRAFT_73481 [Epithele typhae]KAH9945323.1 hypothetical protein BXZ73DRAFT_73481 [Epithele typhae]
MQSPTANRLRPPFYLDDSLVGDIVIQPSYTRHIDAGTFFLHKDVLSRASPVLARLISGITSVSVDEPTTVWKLLIPIFYSPKVPIDFVTNLKGSDGLLDIDLLRTLLDAGRKYEAPSISASVADALMHEPAVVAKKAVGVYALACAFDCPDLARFAARHSLSTKLSFNFSPTEPSLEYMARMSDYHRLLDHRRRCADAARETVHSSAPQIDQPYTGSNNISSSTHFLRSNASKRLWNAITILSGSNMNTISYSTHLTTKCYDQGYSAHLHQSWWIALEDLHRDLEYQPTEDLVRSPSFTRKLLDGIMRCSGPMDASHANAVEVAEILIETVYVCLKEAIDKCKGQDIRCTYCR